MADADLILAETTVADYSGIKLPIGVYDINFKMYSNFSAETDAQVYIYKILTGTDDLQLYRSTPYVSLTNIRTPFSDIIGATENLKGEGKTCQFQKGLILLRSPLFLLF